MKINDNGVLRDVTPADVQETAEWASHDRGVMNPQYSQNIHISDLNERLTRLEYLLTGKEANHAQS